MEHDLLSEPVVSTPENLSIKLQDMNRLCQPVWVFDIDNARVLWCNFACLDLWQAESVEALRSRDMASDMTDTVANRLRQYQTDFKRDENCKFKEVWTLYPNGEPTTAVVELSGIQLDDGRTAMFCEALNEQHLDPDSLRSADALLHTSVMITLYAQTGEPLYKNPAARSITSSLEEPLGTHFSNPNTIQLLENAVTDEIKTVASVQTVNGTRWHDITARRCLDAVSGDQAWLISEVDVSRLKATEERAQFLAEHDTLTMLPNRNHVSVAYQNRIDQLLAQGNSGALIFIDLDRFKDVNDSLGHDAGDQLLIEVARRLSAIAAGGDSVARLGGDEFLLLLDSLSGDKAVEELARRILDVVSRPMTIQGREIQVTPSIGISLFPANGRSIADLMRHADLAMYHVKERGKNDFAFFSKDFSDAVDSRINLETELLVAMQEGQFEAYFQPRVDVRSNIITGAEALARWQHPTKGMILPDQFIPACEDSGLISELGMIVLEQSVCAQRAWKKQGRDLLVSVNLSPLQFSEETLVDDLLRIVSSNQGDPTRIELEITESVLLGHDEATINKLHALVDHGFRIAIDDFGTGYSNLAYLHRYPIRCLKIDRSFIQGLETASPIVELIVSMAGLFQLDVVAEGVETHEQLSALMDFNCQEYQGFLFERPIDFDAFTRLLQLEGRQSA